MTLASASLGISFAGMIRIGRRTRDEGVTKQGARPEALVQRGNEPIVARLECGTSSVVWERPMTEERASLEREILRLRQGTAASEAALQVQGISAKDMDALPPLQDASGGQNRRKPKARPKLNSWGQGTL